MVKLTIAQQCVRHGHLCLCEGARAPAAALQGLVQGQGQLGLSQGRQALANHLQHRLAASGCKTGLSDELQRQEQQQQL